MGNDSWNFGAWLTIIPHSNCTCERCRAGLFSSFGQFSFVFFSLRNRSLSALSAQTETSNFQKKSGWSISAWILPLEPTKQIKMIIFCPFLDFSHQFADFPKELPSFPKVCPMWGQISIQNHSSASRTAPERIPNGSRTTHSDGWEPTTSGSRTRSERDKTQ